MLPGYADRNATAAISYGHGHAGGDTDGQLGTMPDPASTSFADRLTGHTGQHGGGQGFGIDPDDHDAIIRLSRDLVAEVEAALADMPPHPPHPHHRPT
jgi:hypothetical protein